MVVVSIPTMTTPIGVAAHHPGNGLTDRKEPMSVELYHSHCKFLSWNTSEVIAHAFLVLTWNLICCAQNTLPIQMSDICWITLDSMEYFFGHSKTG